MKIVKKDISRFLQKCGHKNSSEFLEALVTVLSHTFAEGHSVRMKNFGSFNIIHKKERMGMNFHTGKSMVISARKSLSFSSAKCIKEKLKKKKSG